jgi:hypothetical protein
MGSMRRALLVVLAGILVGAGPPVVLIVDGAEYPADGVDLGTERGAHDVSVSLAAGKATARADQAGGAAMRPMVPKEPVGTSGPGGSVVAATREPPAPRAFGFAPYLAFGGAGVALGLAQALLAHLAEDAAVLLVAPPQFEPAPVRRGPMFRAPDASRKAVLAALDQVESRGSGAHQPRAA